MENECYVLRKHLKKLLTPFIIIVLIGGLVFKSSNLNSLTVTFDLQEKLAIKICNPSYGFIVLHGNFFNEGDHILYTENMSLILDPEMFHRKIENGPLIHSKGFLIVTESRPLLPKQCLSQTVNIRPLLQEEKPFRVKIKLSESPERLDEKEVSKSVVFESQIFNL